MTIWSFKAFSWAWPNRNVSQIVFPWVDSESSCNVTSTSSLIYSFWAQKYHVSFKSPFLWRFIHWSWTWREVEREQQSMNNHNYSHSSSRSTHSLLTVYSRLNNFLSRSTHVTLMASLLREMLYFHYVYRYIE